MAGGWLARNFIYTGGTITGTTQAQIEKRVNYILTGCAKCLVDAGWILDDRTPYGSPEHYGTGSSSSSHYHAWYRLRSAKGAKLLLMYINYYNDVFAVQQARTKGSQYRMFDLCFSYIPPGVNEDFGTDITSEQVKFIPTHALPLANADTMLNNTYSSASSSYQNNSGTKYEYKFVTDGETIIFVHGASAASTQYMNAICIGEVYGALAYPEIETQPQAKYGILALYNANSSSAQNYHGLNCNLTCYSGNPDSSYYYGHISYCYMNGELFNPTQGYLTLYTDLSLMNTTCNQTYNNGMIRWMPFSCALSASVISTATTVVQGDGFKGWYNTDMIRCVNGSNVQSGTLLDNGNFIVGIPNNGSWGCALGWDPSNSITLWGNNNTTVPEMDPLPE